MPQVNDDAEKQSASEQNSFEASTQQVIPDQIEESNLTTLDQQGEEKEADTSSPTAYANTPLPLPSTPLPTTVALAEAMQTHIVEEPQETSESVSSPGEHIKEDISASPETPQPMTEEAATTEMIPESPSASKEDTSEDTSNVTEKAATTSGEPVAAAATTPLSPLKPQVWAARLHLSIFQALTRHQKLSLGLRLLLVFSILAPLAGGIVYGLSGLSTYNALRAHANQGIQHLQNVKNLLSGSTSQNPAQKTPNLLNPQRIQQAQEEINAARMDFTSAQHILNDSSLVHLVEANFSSYQQQIVAARQALHIGIEATYVGNDALTLVSKLAPKLHTPLLGNTKDPLFTSTDITQIQQTLNQVQPRIDRIATEAQQLQISALPLSDKQRAQAQQYLQMLPQLKQGFSLLESLAGVANWLLGVNTPRTFLLQTMDRGELRATGGFNGQYAEVTVTGGRVSPITLKDIGLLEYAPDTPTSGQPAPEAYRSWWPFDNWGIRDANLSADFPTSAKIITNLYHTEVKRDIDGVIMFSPFMIQRVLAVTGPLTISEYNETVTSQNLEERLHYYQLDNAGIRRSELIEHVEDPAQARKLFTSRVEKALMQRIQNAPVNDLLQLATMFLHSLQTKDLEVYLGNPQAQALLSRYGYAAEVDRATTHDGLYIVQENVSASKASQFTRSIFKDTVSLDAQGGATHVLQLRLAYNQINSVYGLDTLRDYVRIYVPPTAKLLSGDGFYTNDPLCDGGFGTCPRDGIYSQQELICPPGQYEAGASAPMLNDPYYHQWHPLNKIGEPSSSQSDEPGRAMFAGYLVVPKNCTLTATVSWYVPPMGTAPYQLLIQRQSGTFPEWDLSLLPPTGNCASISSAGTYFNGTLTQDQSFQLKSPQQALAHDSNCYPGPGV
ncbi:DUF4012 domain-containing protein [Ktedonobacter robiniae]|uniref:DUF4012 domain-containing protein n=1 Tax=Ktedonobacter robiniae TaxID=2778365 RepID=A0ABQ3UN91_9CHLR|nr:DUF4012 domain-containing protein [Ktedonobacter robiniae]GHO54153.1 hypothetical protein KSB_26280 [Ktedonobacter robiniae]